MNGLTPFYQNAIAILQLQVHVALFLGDLLLHSKVLGHAKYRQVSHFFLFVLLTSIGISSHLSYFYLYHYLEIFDLRVCRLRNFEK